MFCVVQECHGGSNRFWLEYYQNIENISSSARLMKKEGILSREGLAIFSSEVFRVNDLRFPLFWYKSLLRDTYLLLIFPSRFSLLIVLRRICFGLFLMLPHNFANSFFTISFLWAALHYLNYQNHIIRGNWSYLKSINLTTGKAAGGNLVILVDGKVTNITDMRPLG